MKTDYMETTTAETITSLPEGFWGTMMPYFIIAILLIVATAACYIPWRSNAIRRLSVVGIPALLLIAGFMEITLFSKLGKDHVVWWCDMDGVGFFSALLRLFPFVLILALQFHSFFAYQNFIFGPQLLDDPDGSISLKPKAKSFLWLLLVVVLAGVADRVGLQGNTLNITIGIVTLAVLFLIFGKRNFEQFGFGWGAAVTFFAIVYVVGFLLAAYAFIMALLKVFWQMVIWTVSVIVLLNSGIIRTAEEEARERKRLEESRRLQELIERRDRMNQ